jgi:hypothetical protein
MGLLHELTRWQGTGCIERERKEPGAPSRALGGTAGGIDKPSNLTEPRGGSYEKRSARGEGRAAVLRSPRGEVVVFARVNGDVWWGDVVVFCPGHGARVDVTLGSIWLSQRGVRILIRLGTVAARRAYSTLPPRVRFGPCSNQVDQLKQQSSIRTKSTKHDVFDEPEPYGFVTST